MHSKGQSWIDAFRAQDWVRLSRGPAPVDFVHRSKSILWILLHFKYESTNSYENGVLDRSVTSVEEK